MEVRVCLDAFEQHGWVYTGQQGTLILKNCKRSITDLNPCARWFHYAGGHIACIDCINFDFSKILNKCERY